jgi:hypothetical protein
VDIRGFWHDATAYAVLGVTAAILFGGCLLLSPKSDPGVPAMVSTRTERPHFPLAFHGMLSGFLAILAVLVGFKITPAPGQERSPPDLPVLMALDVPDWVRRTDTSIFAFSRALNTSFLHQESYYRGDIQLTLYVAFWPTHQSTLGSVAVHTPDICLPGSGWELITPPSRLDRYPLPSPQRFSFRKNDYPQYVWFWHYFDGTPIVENPGLYPWQLGPLLLKRAVRARAPQWIVRVSSNKPLESLIGEPILQEFFARLKAAGLAGGPSA